MLSRKQESVAWCLSCAGFGEACLETRSSLSTGLGVLQHTLHPVLTNVWHGTCIEGHPATSTCVLHCRDHTAYPGVPRVWAVPSPQQLPGPSLTEGKASASPSGLNMAPAALSCTSH